MFGSLAARALARATSELTWRRFLVSAKGWIPKGDRAVLHAHFGMTGALALPLARWSGLPLVVTFYGVDGSAVLRDPGWQRRYRELFEVAALVLVLCDAVKARLVALGCPEYKVIVWNLPAGVEDFPYREPHPARGVRLLVAARFVEKKGYWVLLRALRRLVDEGRDISLRAIGYGPLRPQIEEWIGAHGLQSRISIVDTGCRPDFHQVFNEAIDLSDIFVLPSMTARDGDDEGGPALTLVCAQAAGLPVVCTPFPGAERSVEDGVTGLYCAENDVDSLVDRLRWLMDRPDEWQTLGRAGSDRVREHFSLGPQLNELVSLYESVAGGPGRPRLASGSPA
jgi:colanic acid/amylovoran biosynthesis glycosyltransferase